MTMQNGTLKSRVDGANIPLLLEAIGEYVTPLPGLDDLEVGTSHSMCCWRCPQHSHCLRDLAGTPTHEAARLQSCHVCVVVLGLGFAHQHKLHYVDGGGCCRRTPSTS